MDQNIIRTYLLRSTMNSMQSYVHVPDKVRTLSQVGACSYKAYAMQELTQGEMAQKVLTWSNSLCSF